MLLKTTPETESATEKWRLLSLPAEIRNQIWELAVVDSEPLAVIRRTAFTMPSVLRTSKQLRAEALSTYLKGNTFQFDLRSTCYLDLDFDVEYFGPLLPHLEATESLQLRITRDMIHLRQTGPQDGWSKLDVVEKSLMKPGWFRCTHHILRDARLQVDSASASSTDGKLHKSDFVYLARFINGWK